jgi:hypothetical protein
MLSSFPNEDLASIAKWLPALQQGMSGKSGLQLLIQQGTNNCGARHGLLAGPLQLICCFLLNYTLNASDLLPPDLLLS